MRSNNGSNALLCACLLMVASGCALDDGDPWGRAHFDLQASFDATPRLDQGRLKTSKNYAVELDDVALAFGTVDLALRAEDTVVNFDPADPPEGYSLCHNGHCHSASGELVDYEDISAELAGGQTSAGGVVQAIDAEVGLDTDDVVDVPLSDCSNDCRLERGLLNTVTLVVRSLRISGRAFDTTEAGRLPEEGMVFQTVIPLDLEFTEVVEGAIADGEPVDVNLLVRLDLTEKFLDPVEFDSTADAGFQDPGVAESIIETIEEESNFTVRISR